MSNDKGRKRRNKSENKKNLNVNLVCYCVHVTQVGIVCFNLDEP